LAHAELEESANGIKPVRRPVLFTTATRECMAANSARWSKSNVSIQNFNLKHLSESFGSMLLADITAEQIGKYQGGCQKQEASSRTIKMEVSTLRMMMKASRLWSAISDDIRMLPERRDIGKAPSRKLKGDREQFVHPICRPSLESNIGLAQKLPDVGLVWRCVRSLGP